MFSTSASALLLVKWSTASRPHVVQPASVAVAEAPRRRASPWAEALSKKGANHVGRTLGEGNEDRVAKKCEWHSKYSSCHMGSSYACKAQHAPQDESQ